MKKDAVRWTVSAALVLSIFIGVITYMLRNAPIAPLPTSASAAIAIELAPAPTAPISPITERQIGPVRKRTAPTKHVTRPVASLPLTRGNDATEPPPDVRAASEISTHAVEDAFSPSTAPETVSTREGAHYAAPQDAAAGTSSRKVAWQSTVLAYLKRYRRYPRQAERSHQEGVTWVGFSVDRFGNVGAAGIKTASGHDALDAEAIATVERRALCLHRPLTFLATR